MPLALRLAVLAFSLPVALGWAQTTPEVQPLPMPQPREPSRPLPTDQPPLSVYFPPGVPRFGSPISANPTVTVTGHSSVVVLAGANTKAPEGLADYVGEYFYPALGTRLSDGSLSRAVGRRLIAYRANRAARLNELLDQLVVVHSLDPSARATRLREFAGVQTPKIVALENEAETLRADLVAGSLLDFDVDWNAGREWRLKDPKLATSYSGAFAEFEVVRAAVFYQKDLTPGQRGLLREVALDLQEKARAAAFRTTAPGRDPLEVYFSPATARLRHPADLPPDLRKQLGVFFSARDALKRELHEAVLAGDAVSESKRNRAFHDLSERQWSRLVALEELAEEVRIGLAALPPPPPPALPAHLPAELANRLANLQRDSLEFEHERAMHQAKADLESRARALAERLKNSGAADDTRIEVTTIRTTRSTGGPGSHSTADAEFMRLNAERYAALRARGVALQAEVTELARTLRDPATGQPYQPAALFRAIAAANQRFDQVAREDVIYRDYRIAMLEPGLSPEQRRLLLASAVSGLAQALPGRESLPRGLNVPAPAW